MFLLRAHPHLCSNDCTVIDINKKLGLLNLLQALLLHGENYLCLGSLGLDQKLELIIVTCLGELWCQNYW